MKFLNSFIMMNCLLLSSPLAAAITSTYNGTGRLTVTTTAGESCIVTAESGFVKVNGSDPDSGPLLSADLLTFTFNGDSGNNFIDLSAITASNFPSFTQATVNAFGGDDNLACSEFSNTINMGPGRDNVANFGPGFSLYDWSAGDGSESIVNDGTGILRLRFQGSTGVDQITLSSPEANVFQLTNELAPETILFENLTDLALQLNDGDDVVVANDLSLANWESSILCNKSGGSLSYDGSTSNQATDFFLNGASTQIQVTPNSGCNFVLNPLFTSVPYDFSITKPNQTVRLEFNLNTNPVLHLLRGFSTISITGTQHDDVFTSGDVGSQSLELLLIEASDGSDTVNTVFQTRTRLKFSEVPFYDGVDKLTVDAQGNVVKTLEGSFEAQGPFGIIEFVDVEVVELLNAIDVPTNLWLVE